jgi:hypothetical protein
MSGAGLSVSMPFGIRSPAIAGPEREKAPEGLSDGSAAKERKIAALPRHQQERAKGLEPSTSSLGIGGDGVPSPTGKGLTKTRRKRCTDCCTARGERSKPRRQPRSGMRGGPQQLDLESASPEILKLATELASLPPEALAALRVLLGERPTGR